MKALEKDSFCIGTALGPQRPFCVAFERLMIDVDRFLSRFNVNMHISSIDYRLPPPISFPAR